MQTQAMGTLDVLSLQKPYQNFPAAAILMCTHSIHLKRKKKMILLVLTESVLPTTVHV